MEKDQSSFAKAIDEREKRQYELAVLLEDETVEPIVADFLLKKQAEVYQKEGPKNINLAYPIKKHNSASLMIYLLSSYPDLILPLKEELRDLPHVLRFLLITPPLIRVKRLPLSREAHSPIVDIKPPKVDVVPNEVLEETLEKILQ